MKYFTREVERVDIGQRAGVPLVARVERRAFDLGVHKTNGGLSLRLEWLRPLALEVGPATGSVERSLEVSPDPWLRALLGIVIVWTLSTAILLLAGAIRSRANR
jgi:hypothetical protein